jgi:Spy/CpxP family protein refolding chaperone
MTRAVVITGFLIAFAAGLVVGTRVHPKVETPATRPVHRGGWLASDLNLTPQQQEEMKRIWSDTASGDRQGRDERRRDLARQRDEAIKAIVRPEDKQRYEEILRTYDTDSAALAREGRADFQKAVERTKQILTPDQRARYEEFLRRHDPSRERRRGDREHGPGRRSGPHGSTRPASQP